MPSCGRSSRIKPLTIAISESPSPSGSIAMYTQRGRTCGLGTWIRIVSWPNTFSSSSRSNEASSLPVTIPAFSRSPRPTSSISYRRLFLSWRGPLFQLGRTSVLCVHLSISARESSLHLAQMVSRRITLKKGSPSASVMSSRAENQFSSSSGVEMQMSEHDFISSRGTIVSKKRSFLT